MMLVNEDANFTITQLSLYVLVYYYFFFTLFVNGNIAYVINYQIDLDFEMYTGKGNSSHQINEIHTKHLYYILNRNNTQDRQNLHRKRNKYIGN